MVRGDQKAHEEKRYRYISVLFCFHCDRKDNFIIAMYRVRKEALAQGNWREVMEKRSDTLPYCTVTLCVSI